MKILFKLHAIRGGEETGSNIAQLSCQKMEVLGVLGPRAIRVSEGCWERGNRALDSSLHLGGGTDRVSVSKEVTPPGNYLHVEQKDSLRS